jgi:pyruvate dehydrogenase E1 component beta subunit
VRTIQPLDRAALCDSVARTGRLVTVHEAWVTAGVGAEIVAAIAETMVLRAPVARVGALPVPTPSGKVRPFALPNVERIVAAVRAVVDRPATPIL